MLQNLRDKTSGWIAPAILMLLMIPFVFVVDNSYLGGVGAGNVAKVQAPPTWWRSAPSWWPVSLLWQHHEISTEDFRTRFEQVRQQMRQQEGDNFDPRKFESMETKLRVLDQLIDEQAVRLAADEAGIVVGDAAVRDYITNIPAFQIDGKFDANQYRLALAQGTPPRTPAQFDALVRGGLQQSVIPDAINDSAFVTSGEFDRLMKLLGEHRDVELAVLPAPEADTAPVSDSQIKQWYDTHAADFRQPEASTIEYVELDAAHMPEVKPADEATLRKLYEDQKARFVEPEQRLASHILISAGDDAAAQKAAEEKAKHLADEARAANADFAALAKANSEDPGSKDAGGDLGWVEKGVMTKSFEDALFAAKAGDVIGPVKTEFGWHVIKLREVKGGEGRSFEQVRDQLAAEQLKNDTDKQYSDLAGRLVDEVNKNPTELRAAAEALGLEVKTVGPFSKADASGIAANPAVQRAAFSESLVQDGTVSDSINLGNNHSLMLRVTQHTAETQLPLEQVKDKVVAAIHADRSEQAQQKAADAMLARLAKGETLQAVAAAEKLSVQPLPGLPRTAPVPTEEANRIIFTAAAPVDGKPTTGKLELADGRVALFAVNKVIPGNLSEIPEEQRNVLRQQLSQMDGMAAGADFVRAIRGELKITTQPDQL